jgi:uncharacterized protein
MENIKSFFFDTYALHEVIHENKNYSPYTKGITIITTKLNLMEIHYILLRSQGLEYANNAFDYFNNFCVEIPDEVIKEANEFRLSNRKKDLSYTDCVGYILAKRLNAKFLTGDKEFEKLDNVEFVK